MISAGRVLIIPKGEYDATTSYSPLDLVSYNGSSYIAKQNTTGNLPTNTTYWQLSAYGGSAANLAANFAPLEITDYASKSYAIDDFLVTKDNQFCKVIANILLGDELVLDTNIEATDVVTVIQDVEDNVDEVSSEIQTLTNKLNDEVATRAKLGAHNLCSFNDSFTLIRGTDDTNRIKNIYINTVPTLDSYVVSFKVSNASNATKINVQMGNRSSVGTAQAVTDLSTGRKTLTFTFSEEVNRLYFYLTSTDPSDATITISEVMITSPTDPSTEYSPYAKTNRELTEKINEEFLQNAASISAQINYKDVYLFTTNGGASSGSAQYSSAYLVFGQATTQITYFALKEGTEITPSVDGTTFTLTASTSITMAYRKL